MNIRKRTVALLGCAVTAGVIAGCGGGSAEPTAAELLRRKQLRESSQLSKPKSTGERLKAAQAFLDDGNLVEADNALRSLLITEPNNPDVILLSAKGAAARGDRKSAIKMLGAIDESDQLSYIESRWLAAELLAEETDFVAAEKSLKQILQLSGDDARVHHRLATLLFHQGRGVEAAPHLQFLVRSGDITEKELFSMNNYDEPVIDDSMPETDYGGGLNPAMLHRAKLLQSEGEWQKSQNITEQLHARFPQSTPIAAFLGRIYAELQEDESLQRWIASLPEGIEREPEYWRSLGMWLQRQGRHREAVRCLGEAVTRDPTERYSYLVLARSLTALDRTKLATCLQRRFELLDEAAKINKKFGLAETTRDDINRMAEILDLVGRPWESLAWRSVGVKRNRGSDNESQELRQDREQLAASSVAPAGLQLCGLDLEEWPMPLAKDLPPSESRSVKSEPIARGQLVLQNVAADAGLVFLYDNGYDANNGRRPIYQLTGGGIGVIDFDLDGWPDLHLTQGGGDAFDVDGSKPNGSFRNIGGKFVDVSSLIGTDDRGYGQGVSVSDINQDGFADLVIANLGPNWLFINNGDGTFRRVAIVGSSDDGGWTTSIACGDISGDHLPEIVEINYIDDPKALTSDCENENSSCQPNAFRPAADSVLSVGRDGSISRWNGCQAIAEKPSYGFAAMIANFDHRAGNDLYIANDTRPNHYWISQSKTDGQDKYRLVESGQIYGCATGVHGQPHGCMGVAHGDFDRNGWLDLHVTNFWNEPADLYLQQPTGLFSSQKAARGLFSFSQQTVGWGSQAADFDRNGWLDLAVLNGHVKDRRKHGEPFQMKPQLFAADDESFHLVSPQTSGTYWQTSSLGRTMAVLDFNRDAKPDLVTNHLDVTAALLENRTTGGGRSIQLELIGTTSERDAIGAAVTLTADDQTWYSWVAGGDGFLCSNESVVDMGVGKSQTIDLIEVQWPSGNKQQFQNLATGTRYVIVEGADEVFPRVSPRLPELR